MISKENLKIPHFSNQPPGSEVEETILRLVAFKDDEMFASGTCVPIASNLLMTAKHVIEDFCKRYDPLLRTSPNTKNFSIWVFQVRTGPWYGIWSVESCTLSPYTDVAFLKVKPYNQEAFEYGFLRSFVINLIPPPVGSTITGYGYSDSEVKIGFSENGTKNIEVNDKPALTLGQVVDIHEPYRDTSRLNFPCYQVNALFKGGMSGGPIFNENGEVCGLICQSLVTKNDEEEEAISYVTTLWPSMATLFHANKYGKSIKEPEPIIELVKGGIISAKNWEKINLVGQKPFTISINKYLETDEYMKIV